MSKKTLILISCLVLSLTIGLGGSLAYLTDTDTKVNTFTMGNVDIEVEEPTGTEYPGLKPGITVDKQAKINNVGDNDAWVWMTVAIPMEIAHVVTPNWNTDIVNPDTAVIEGTIKDENDKEYKLYTVKYNRILKSHQDPVDTTDILLKSVSMAANVDRIGDDFYLVEAGKDPQPINYNLSNFDVIVSGYAIQAEGIDTLEQAMAHYYGQYDAVLKEIPVKVDSVDSLVSAAAVGDVTLNKNIEGVAENIVFVGDVNGNGHEVRVEPYEYNSNCTFTMNEGTIKNIAIFAAPRAIGNGSTGAHVMTGDLTIECVYIDDGTYGINIGNGGGHNVYINGSNIFGWNSIANAKTFVSHSELGKRNSTYMGAFAVYEDMSFENCDFMNSYKLFGRTVAAGASDDITIKINDCVYWYNERFEEAVEGTDYVRITADNFVSLFVEEDDAEARKWTVIVDGTEVVR